MLRSDSESRLAKFPLPTPSEESEGPDRAARRVARALQRNRDSLGSFLISLLFHSALLAGLAFFFFAWQPPTQRTISITADVVSPPAAEWNLDEPASPAIEMVVVDDEISLLNEESSDSMIARGLDSPGELRLKEEDSSSSQMTSELAKDVRMETVGTLPTGGGLSGRGTEARARQVAKHGGTPDSERAVEQGLKWLAAHQRYDGSWRLDLEQAPCSGRCRNSGEQESSTAATGLALLAFLGAGYTQDFGPYQHEVQSGLNFLLDHGRKTYYGLDLRGEGNMYAQGIATLALSEAYAMTQDERLKEPVELAAHYIVTAQHSKGGWRYLPGAPGDMTVTGWQLMALKSCARSEIDVPRTVWSNASRFLASLSNSSQGTFGYLNAKPAPGPTAIGLLMRMYLGWTRERDELRLGVAELLDQGPSRSDIYFDYYATLVLFHYGGDDWTRWNESMRELLVRSQATTGHEAGSWYLDNAHARSGGRLYTTAMAIMILEVYYRYLPLYER